MVASITVVRSPTVTVTSLMMPRGISTAPETSLLGPLQLAVDPGDEVALAHGALAHHESRAPGVDDNCLGVALYCGPDSGDRNWGGKRLLGVK
jgi:hypothetical protein